MHNLGFEGKVPTAANGIVIKKSICTICDQHCGIDLYVRDGTVIKVEGSPENPYNQGRLCAKGAATRQYLYHEDRLKTPLKRSGPRGAGRFEAIGWDEALATIAAKFNAIKREIGPEAVAVFTGYSKHYRPFLKRLTHSFGSPNYMTESSTCYQAMVMAQKLVFGRMGGPDMANARCLLIWSANPFHSNVSNARNLLAAKERGLKIIAVDPRITPTTARADIHLRLRPGTDGALALAMANVIIGEGLYDREFVSKYTYGFDEYKEYVHQFTPEKGEQLTGVPADKIRHAARLYAGTKPASIMPSASPVVHHTNGVQNYRAVFALAGLTGNYDVIGGNRVMPPGYIHVFPGLMLRGEEFAQSRPWDAMAPRIGLDRFPAWGELVDEAQAMHLPNQLRTEKPYPVKALLGFGLNHRMWPDPEGLLASFAKLDFFVNVEIFRTEACKYADIVLPACTTIERSELRCYPQKYLIFTQPAIDPLFESRSDMDIIFDLAARLGIGDPLLRAGHEAAVDWILEPSGLTVAELKRHPAGLAVPNPLAVPERKYLDGGFGTSSGKLEFKSALLEKYTDTFGYKALPEYEPPKFSREAAPDMAAEYPFVLNTGSRLPMFLHSRTFRLPWAASLRPEPAADICPGDAARLGLRQGDSIRISTPQGSITVQANLTHMALPGVVHMYHGYPQADVNELIAADYLDPISGFPGFKSLLCKVERVG